MRGPSITPGVLLWTPVFVVMAAIFAVSSLHQPPMPGGVSDKWAHTLAYFALGVTVMRAVAGGLSRRVTPRTALIAIAIAALYGVTDEVHQAFVPGRTPDVTDLAADIVGALLAAAICWAWGIISTRPDARGFRHDL
jgi:VanZ family protein